MSESAYADFHARAVDYWTLTKIVWVLLWDERVIMPRGGGEARADQVGLAARLAHETLISDEMARLLEEVRGYEASLEYDSDEASLIRWVRHEHEKNRCVPADLASELRRAASTALPVWQQARIDNDFASFLPHLRRNIELRREYVSCFPKADEDYDLLLDEYEPGMLTAEVRQTLQTLKEGLVPLIGEIAERSDAVDDSFLHGDFPIERQKEVEALILERFGFDHDTWRIDETVHPFASSSSPTDIRLTTKHHQTHLHSLFSTMHEFGHGLYERQVGASLARTPLARGTSLGIHESQSRMWENLVGRSREFWIYFYPHLQKAFPAAFDSVELERFYRGINKVQPNLIRIDSDEATYNLHIILRFELEQEMLGGGLDLADMPEAWNTRVKDYLGIDVPSDADGVLQDMHWAGGNIGYFSTYTLGNIISLQLWERITAEIPDLHEGFARGEFGPLREWLGENIHHWGRKLRPKELLERVLGGGLDSGPYLRYLRAKLGEIYGLTGG